MTYSGRSFRDERIVVDGGSFTSCEMENCEIVYSGGDLPSFVDCSISNCQFMLRGAAQRTMVWLSLMYNEMGDPGLQQLVERWFNDVKIGPPPVNRS